MRSDDLPTLDRPRKATSGTRVPPVGSFCFRHSVAVQSLRGGCSRKKAVAASRPSDVGGAVSQYQDREISNSEESVRKVGAAW